MVLKHFGRDSTVNFIKITVFIVSIAHYGRDSTDIFHENQSFYSNQCSKTNYDQSQMSPKSKNKAVIQCHKTLYFLN